VLSSPVDCSATLELLMVRFDNPSDRKQNGDACDIPGRGECDHIFKFALDLGSR